MATTAVLSVEGLGKSFPGVRALDDFSLDLLPGEVHCLLGENGAGKSTVINILSGAFRVYDGRILVKGRAERIQSPADARRLHIGTIHQELHLVPAMTVRENILLGNEPSSARGILDEAEATRRVDAVMADLQLAIDPRARVRDLSTAHQQMIEIAKALVHANDVLILDEPTASIADKDVAELFRIIRHLKARGTSFIYVSHRLRELPQIGDRITVMRDGRRVTTLAMAEADTSRLIELMVGRAVSERKHRGRSGRIGEAAVLEVSGLSWRQRVKDASFTLKQGEILGFAGLVGSGRTELMKLVFGAARPEGGEIRLRAGRVEIRSPEEAVRLGIGYLSEDRKREGLVLSLSIASNIVLANLGAVAKGFVLDLAAERETARAYVKSLRISCTSEAKLVRYLSGGNQQKVVVAKWLVSGCEVLIFDEPTRGIDVGARAEIHDLVVELADQGKSVIVVSSDLPEIMQLCDRILVMAEGRITGELVNAPSLTQHDVMSRMLAGAHAR